MGTLKQGAHQAVVNCMKIKPEDKVVFVGDNHSKKIVLALSYESNKITKQEAKLFSLDDYGKRPLLKLPSEILEAVKKSSAVFYTAQSYPGEMETIRMPIIREATKHGRQAHMPNINEQLMKEGMCADYEEISRISKKVYDCVKNARKIQVLTENGTDFTAELSEKIKWMISDGYIAKGEWKNLPSGEVFTCVKNLNGKMVVDGSIGDYFGSKYGLLEKTPVIITVNNSYITELKCKNAELEKELLKYIKQDKNACRIGEFALGTNIRLKKLVGNLLQDEKFPGVHVAIGHGYPEETGSKWDSKAHCDLVIKQTTVIADGKKIMEKGKYLI